MSDINYIRNRIKHGDESRNVDEIIAEAAIPTVSASVIDQTIRESRQKKKKNPSKFLDLF